MVQKNLIVFNGEIYNFKELRKYIDEKKLKSRSDTEVLINLYEKIGNKIFDKIEGMYSFLIYNFETKKILAARDNFGIKPLYFYEDKDDLIFSSEIKPILKYKKYFEYEISSLSNFLLLGKQDNHSQTFLKISNQSNHLIIIIFFIMEKNKSIIIGRFIKKF